IDDQAQRRTGGVEILIVEIAARLDAAGDRAQLETGCEFQRAAGMDCKAVAPDVAPPPARSEQQPSEPRPQCPTRLPSSACKTQNALTYNSADNTSDLPL